MLLRTELRRRHFSTQIHTKISFVIRKKGSIVFERLLSYNTNYSKYILALDLAANVLGEQKGENTVGLA